MNSNNQIPNVTCELEPLLDEKEPAIVLGVAKSTPGCWRRATPVVGPAFVVVEGLIRYSPEDLRCYVAGNRRDPSTEVEK